MLFNVVSEQLKICIKCKKTIRVFHKKYFLPIFCTPGSSVAWVESPDNYLFLNF